MSLRLRALALVLPGLAPAAGVGGQPVTGYFQTVPIAGVEGAVLADFNRLRLASEPEFGPFRFEVAYEHVLTLRRSATRPRFTLGVAPGGGEWLDLEWTVTEREHVSWRHRLDRLNVGWTPTGQLEITAGRQAVSWGTTLFLTPADPFTPFDPVDPFRQFRAGVDAARVRFHPGALSEVDLVVRPTPSPDGDEITALARGLTTVRNWEISGWAGALYGDPAAAGAFSGALGPWALRGEAVLRSLEDRQVFRGVLGVDRLLRLSGRDVTLAAEYQRDGLGAAGPDGYPGVLRSDFFRRGEHQVLGRDEGILQASLAIHPLWAVSTLFLLNLNDGSGVIGPTLGYSAADEVALAAGGFMGFGADRETPSRPIPSEHGMARLTGYISLVWYF